MKHKFLGFILIVIISLEGSCSENNDSHEDEGPIIEKIISYNQPNSKRYAQGLEIYGGFVFQAFSDGTIDIYDLTSNNLIQTLGPLVDEKGIALHMNDLAFANIDNDLCLIVSGNSASSPFFVFQVIYQGGSFTLAKSQIIPPPPIDTNIYFETTQYFGDRNTCLQVAYKKLENGCYGDIVIECFSFNQLSFDITYTPIWKIEYPKLWAMQGSVIIDNNCYMNVGVPHGDAKIYKINMNNGEIECLVDFRNNGSLIEYEEMQGIAYFNKGLYFSTTYGLYRINKGFINELSL